MLHLRDVLYQREPRGVRFDLLRDSAKASSGKRMTDLEVEEEKELTRKRGKCISYKWKHIHTHNRTGGRPGEAVLLS